MFHVKHTYFAGLKTLILSNTACLEPSFTLQRAPARYALDLAPGSDRYDKLLALAIAPQILTKETRIVFLLYRERARWSYNKTIRAHQPHSTPSSIKPRRRLHLNARASNVSYHFRHTPQPPIFLPTTNTLPQSKPPSPQKTRRMLSSDSPAKNHQNLNKHCLFVAVSRKTSPQIAHIDTSKPVGIAARSPTPNDKTYRAVQARFYRSPAIHPPPVYIWCAALSVISR